MSGPQPKKKVDCIYAWIAIDENGDEGVVGAINPGMGAVPLVGADLARIESFRHIAIQAASVSSKVSLVRYAVRSDLETLDPKG